MPTHRFSSPRQQRGITLIESLIALIVAALGILGIVGMQMRTLADTQTSVRRAQAIRLVEDLSERMRVAPNALINLDNYVSDFEDDTDIDVDCAATACSNNDLVKFNLQTWKQAVQIALPLGGAKVFAAPDEAAAGDGNQRQLGVLLRWSEKERHDADDDYREAINAVLSAGGLADDCAAGYTCHLQYVPVAARCASYATSSEADPQFFCPGA